MSGGLPVGGGLPRRAGLLRLLLVPVLVMATTTVGLAVAVGSSSPAGADPIGSCTSTSGVIVAVDFAPWGGNIERGCDATLTTGYDALQAAGFTTAGDEHDGPEFICRIDDDPPPSQDPCVNTPPATAYWSYWHADAGQDTWTYSTLGRPAISPCRAASTPGPSGRPISAVRTGSPRSRPARCGPSTQR